MRGGDPPPSPDYLSDFCDLCDSMYSWELCYPWDLWDLCDLQDP